MLMCVLAEGEGRRWNEILKCVNYSRMAPAASALNFILFFRCAIENLLAYKLFKLPTDHLENRD